MSRVEEVPRTEDEPEGWQHGFWFGIASMLVAIGAYLLWPR